MTPRLLVLCLDGIDHRVASALMAEGRMPTLAGLRRGGVEITADAGGRTMDQSVWPGLLSGQPLGNVALCHFQEFDPRTMGTRRRAEADPEPFWLHLPDRGSGALVLDPPELHPHPDSRADTTCCWHAKDPSHPPLVTSVDLRRALEAFGRRPALTTTLGALDTEQERRVADMLVTSVAYRGRVAASLAAGRRTVCVAVHEPHVGVHHLGHHVDPDAWYRSDHPDPSLVTNHYEAVDRALGPLVESFGPGNVVVVMARGIRPADHAGHLLEGLLERAGLLVTRRPGRPGPPGPGGQRAWLSQTARSLVPADLRERLAMRVLPPTVQHRLASRRFADAYVWEATRVFSPPSWTSGFLRVNLVGREAAGVVPEHDFEAVLAEVTTLVADMVDASTGEPLVHEVIRTSRAFPGSHSHLLPDLLVTWAKSGPTRRVRHHRLGCWEAEPVGYVFSEHSEQATVLLAGPDVRPSPTPVAANATGLAPTLLSLQGVSRPSVMVGDDWRDILDG